MCFSDGPARTLGARCPFLARTTDELCSSPEPCSSPAASYNPLKTNAASPTAAVPPGKLRGSERSGLAGTACASDQFSDCGGRGCNVFVPVLGGNGTKIVPTGDIFDQPPGQMRYIRGKLGDHVGDHVVSSPQGSVLVTFPGTKSSYLCPPQSLNPSSGGALGCSTFPATLREIPGPRPEDLRGRHRSRLFETTSTLGEVLGDGRYPS